MRKLIYLVTAMFFISLSAQSAPPIFCKKKKAAKNQPTAVVAPKSDKTPAKGPKAYAEVIGKKANTVKGLFTVHKVDGNWFFEIPDSLIGRDLLVVNRISKSAAGSRKGFIGYAGDQIGSNVIRLEKGSGDRLLLKRISYSERSQDSLGMYQSVLNSNLQPIMASFDIKTYKTDSLNKSRFTVIDVTDFVKSDNSILHFDERIKKALSLGGLLADRSYVDTIRTYPLNVEIRTVKTYSQKPQNPTDATPDPLTYELNSSMLLLPKEPMKPRYYDPRVGYFTSSYTDFDKNPQGVERVAMITRWRLEPKEEDIEKYKNGELVEPKKPIVFYIDPTTPKKWVPYLIQGVNDWQSAFEHAGFKNAIMALEAPDNPEWNIDDARHSAIVYKPSTVPNASGPHVNDPRSGEIIESHINWYHNVMKLLHDWYFIQTAAVDTAARSMQYEDELMGQLIRFVSSHEVGHTLGLRHNFGSSNTVSVEKLRDKTWVEANGHTPSIMDYARFNYIAQPEDNIGRDGLFPRIGIYDNWSIQWGYTWTPQFETAQDEVSYLQKMVQDKLAEDKRYTFGTETDPSDPRNQNEDLGDNAMLAGLYGIKNLQRIVPNLLEWTQIPNKDNGNASTMYNEVTNQFNRYIGHVAKNIGGIYSTPRFVEEQANVIEYVPATTQKEAMRFLDKQLFNTPLWLVDKNLIQKTNVDPLNTIANIQKNVLGRLFSKFTVDKLLQDELLNGSKAYTATTMMDDLKKSVWSELGSGKEIDIYRRHLQKNYVDAVIAMLNASAQNVSDATALARLHLNTLKTELSRAANAANGISKAHLVEQLAKIEQALNPKK